MGFAPNYFGEGTPTYLWDFGTDATPATSTEANPLVTFNTSGEHIINLAVTNGSTISYDYSIIIDAAPDDAGTITGNLAPQIGTATTYSVVDVPNALTYAWELPTGATGTSTTKTINVTFSQSGAGTIKVTPQNTCGDGVFSTLDIEVLTFITENGTKTVSIYPNPTTDYVNVTNAENTVINIYDMTGKIVKTCNITESNSFIDITNLNSGNYIFEVIYDNQKLSKIINVVK